MAPESEVVAQRFTTLRLIHGLTQGQLAEMLGVSQTFLSHISRGARPVPAAMVVSACRRFGLPAAFFTVRQSPAELGSVTFRKGSRASARDEDRIIALYDEAARLFRELSLASGYRAADLPDPAAYGGDVERIAEAFRTASGLGVEDPVPNATRTLEGLGIGVVDNLDHLEAGAGGHTAVSRPSRYNDRPLVALVAQVPGAVKRLTLLHEVGHLIFDQSLAGPLTSTRSPEEKRAYKFAGAFLLPQNVARARISESLNLHGYLPVKADYGMTVGAIIMRARELRIITPDRARSLQIQLSSQGWRDGEPVPVADEQPLLFGQALRKVYGRQATARAAHVLGAAPEWINQWTHSHAQAVEPHRAKVIDLTAARAHRGS